MIGTFSEQALAEVEAMFAEGQPNPFAGECGQKKKREAAAGPRTPQEEAADQARSQAQKGKARAGSNRSEAAKKAAETRRKCKGGSPTPTNAAGPTT